MFCPGGGGRGRGRRRGQGQTPAQTQLCPPLVNEGGQRAVLAAGHSVKMNHRVLRPARHSIEKRSAGRTIEFWHLVGEGAIVVVDPVHV